MKSLKNVLVALAFVFAFCTAFTSSAVQSAFYDANGVLPGGGTPGVITSTSQTCAVQTGTICLIGSEWAFNTAPNAEANQGQQSNPNAVGLLRHK